MPNAIRAIFLKGAIHLDVKHHVDAGHYYYDVIDRFAKIKINAVIVEFGDKKAGAWSAQYKEKLQRAKDEVRRYEGFKNTIGRSCNWREETCIHWS